MTRFWEAPGPPKIRKNQKKLIFDRVQFRRRVLGGFREGFGRILGGFGEDFGKVWGGFWEGFGKILGRIFWKDLEGQTMIRATMGTSIDR